MSAVTSRPPKVRYLLGLMGCTTFSRRPTLINVRDLTEVAELLGWSDRQVYGRFRSAQQLLAGHYQKGQQNRIMLDEHAFTLMRRLQEIEREGFTTTAAVEQVASELEKPHPNGHTVIGEHHENDAIAALKQTIDLLSRQVQAKDEQLAGQVREIDRLHDLLSRQLPSSSEGHQRLSIGARLRVALTGKV